MIDATPQPMSEFRQSDKPDTSPRFKVPLIIRIVVPGKIDPRQGRVIDLGIESLDELIEFVKQAKTKTFIVPMPLAVSLFTYLVQVLGLTEEA